MDPKDDYAQLALICHDLLKNYIDPSKLDGKDRYLFDALVEDFLLKKLLETNKTVDDFVREPRKLLAHFKNIKQN